MDWVGTLFVLVVVAVGVGLVLERRRRRSRTADPSHAGEHRPAGAAAGGPQSVEAQHTDQRFGGYTGG